MTTLPANGSVWMNLATDPTQTLEFPFGTGLQSQPAITVSSNGYAAGNSRKTRVPGYQAKIACTLQAVTPAQLKLLEYDAPNGGWLGETLCFRDMNGRKFYGYFDSPQITPHGYNNEADVQLTVTQTSWTEVQ